MATYGVAYVLIETIVLTSLQFAPEQTQSAVVLDATHNHRGCNTWQLALTNGKKMRVCYTLFQPAPTNLIGQTVSIRLRENALGYYIKQK